MNHDVSSKYRNVLQLAHTHLGIHCTWSSHQGHHLPLSKASKASAYWSIFDAGCCCCCFFSALLIGDGDLESVLVLDLLVSPPRAPLPSSLSFAKAKSLWLNASSQLGYSCLAAGEGGPRGGGADLLGDCFLRPRVSSPP